jgi:alkyl hydroperoxide reductase subunit AhpF
MKSMALLSPSDAQLLRNEFSAMTRPVRLLFFTQTLDCETCLTTRQILDELPVLSDKVSIEEINFVLEPDKARQFGVERVPAIVPIWRDEHEVDQDSRIRFLGMPAGYEFVNLVQSVLLVGGGPSHLSDQSRAQLAALDRPITMQVFTTPT